VVVQVGVVDNNKKRGIDMQYLSINDLKIPFLVARRGRGSNEVISKVCINYENDVSLFDIIKVMTDYQKKVINKDLLLDIIEDLKKLGSLKFLEILFFLPVDRVSVYLKESLSYLLECGYKFEKDNDELIMIIKCPVPVDYLFPFLGEVYLEVNNPSLNFYFEDLLDLLQRYGSVIIYPMVSFEDLPRLSTSFESRVTLDEFLRIMKSIFTKRKLCENGKICVKFRDMYGLYTVEKGIVW